jgi:mono/diheme cytochrome c family protein
MKPGAALILLVFAFALPACSRSSGSPATNPSDASETSGEDTPVTVQDELVGRGEAIAEAACAGCHALGAADESPHSDAPPLRLLSQTIALDSLEARFADGSVSDHPDMPDWQFEQIDAAGLVAYLKSVQTGSAD